MQKQPDQSLKSNGFAVLTKKYTPHWLFALAFVSFWYFPRTAEKGMFIDGLVYTTVSHNLSEGIGTFWQPILKNSEFLFHKGEVFYDHPPLVFGMEAIFFSVFGDAAVWIYNTVILLLLLTALLLLFRQVMPGNKEVIKLGFLPVILLFTAAELSTKVTYNLLDTSMAVFTSFSVYFMLRSLPGKQYSWLFLLLGGLCLVLAFLTKGPVGLFPLAAPMLYALCFPEHCSPGRAIRSTLILLTTLILTALLLYGYGPSNHFFDQYLHQQVITSMKGEREKADTLYNHFSLIIKLLTQLAPMLIIVLVAMGIQAWKQTSLLKENRKSVLFLLGIGLSASLPIALSAKNHSFYLIPSFIFFALAASCYLLHFFKVDYAEQRKKRNQYISILMMIILGGIIIYSFSRKEKYYRTHSAFLKEMEMLDPELPYRTILCVSDSIRYKRGDISCYLERYHLIEFVNFTDSCAYGLIFKSDSLTVPIPERAIGTKNFYLFKQPGAEEKQ